MNKLETLVILSRILGNSNKQPSLQESIARKVESDSKKFLLIATLGALIVFFVSISITLGLYLSIDLASSSILQTKIIYLIASLMILSTLFIYYINKQFRKKTTEYKELANQAPDPMSPLKIIIGEFASQLMAEHELMMRKKTTVEFTHDHSNNLH